MKGSALAATDLPNAQEGRRVTSTFRQWERASSLFLEWDSRSAY